MGAVLKTRPGAVLVDVLKTSSKNTDLCLLSELLLHSLTLCLQQSLQAKQRSLLERVDALDQECEELQGQLGETEDTQTDLQDRLTHISEEKDQLKTQLTQEQVHYYQTDVTQRNIKHNKMFHIIVHFIVLLAYVGQSHTSA